MVINRTALKFNKILHFAGFNMLHLNYNSFSFYPFLLEIHCHCKSQIIANATFMDAILTWGNYYCHPRSRKSAKHWVPYVRILLRVCWKNFLLTEIRQGTLYHQLPTFYTIFIISLWFNSSPKASTICRMGYCVFHFPVFESHPSVRDGYMYYLCFLNIKYN